VPVAGGEDGKVFSRKPLEVFVQYRDDLIAPRDCQSSAGKKIVLDVYDDQSIAFVELKHAAPSR
jgi:hypothetical protein